jgi:hypothetical protein
VFVPVLAQVLAPAPPAQVNSMKITPATALERLFTAPSPQSDWFADAFLAQVPLTQVEQIVAGFRTSLGAYRSVKPEGDNYLVQFEKGKLSAQILLNESGQIIGLLLQPRSNPDRPQSNSLRIETLV